MMMSQPGRNGRTLIFPGGEKPKFVSKNPSVKIILERVRFSSYISGDSKAELAKLIASLPEEEIEPLVAELKSRLNSVFHVWCANSICVLGLLGGNARSAVKAIVQATNCWNCKVTMQAADVLPKIDVSAAVNALVEAFHQVPHANGTISWTHKDASIVECLEAIGPAAIAAAPALCAYLHFIDCTNSALIAIGPAVVPAVLKEVQCATNARLQYICANAAEIFSAFGVDAKVALNKTLKEALKESLASCPIDNRSRITTIIDLLDAPKSAKSEEDVNKVLSAVLAGRKFRNGASESISYSKSALQTLLAPMTDAQKEELVGQLLKHVNSYRHIDQYNSLFVLGLLGAQAHTATATIVESFNKMSCATVMLAADTLSKIGATYAVPELIACLPAGAPRMTVNSLSLTEERAVECLEVFGESLSDNAPFLAAFLATNGVAPLLASIGPAAIPAIIAEVERGAVRQKFTGTCSGAAEALSAIGAASSKPLIEALAASSNETREAYTLVFSTLKAPALDITAAPLLSSLLLNQAGSGISNNVSGNIHRNVKRALVALGEQAAPAVFAGLAAHIDTKDFRHSSAANVLDELLKEFGPSALPVLTACLPDLTSRDQANLASAILRRDQNNIEAGQVLLTQLESKDVEVKKVAMRAVAAAQVYTSTPGEVVEGLVSEKLVPLVQQTWQDPDSSVRQLAAEIMPRLASSPRKRPPIEPKEIKAVSESEAKTQTKTKTETESINESAIAAVLDMVRSAASHLALLEPIAALNDREKNKLVKPLVALLLPEHNAIRNNVIYSLGQLGQPAKSAAAKIAEGINQASLSEVELTALFYVDPFFTIEQVLNKVGPRAIPGILNLVKQTDLKALEYNVRSVPHYAARALTEYGAASTQPIIDALSASSSSECEALLDLITELKRPALSDDMAPLLFRIYVDALNNRPGRPLHPASKALSALGQAALPCYCEAFSKTTFKSWIIVQSPLQNHRAIPVLKTNLSHSDIAVQANAAAVLLKVATIALERIESQIGDPEPLIQLSTEKLVELLSDSDEQVRIVALEALTVASNQCNYLPNLIMPPKILTILHDKTSPLCMQATSAYGAVGMRTIDAFAKLAEYGYLTETQVSQASVPPISSVQSNSSVPSMPSFQFMKETIERDLAEGILPNSADVETRNLEGELVFDASRTNQRLNVRVFGQPAFFKKHLIVVAAIRNSKNTRGGNSFFYAYDGQRMLLLSGKSLNPSLKEVLSSEFPNLEEVDAKELAWFFCHLLISGAHTVVDAGDGVEKGSIITDPVVTGSTINGWKLHFWTVQSYGGCTNASSILCEHTISISAQFEVVHTQH